MLQKQFPNLSDFINYVLGLTFHVGAGQLQLCFSLWLCTICFIHFGFQAEVAVIYSYLGSDDHMAVLNVSAYMVHKSLLHTIYSLVKKSSLAKPVSVG